MIKKSLYIQLTLALTLFFLSCSSNVGYFYGQKNSAISADEFCFITYDVNGATRTAKVKKGIKLTEKELPAITDECYKFLGWYNDSDELVNIGDVIIKNITITAKWEQKQTADVKFYPSETNLNKGDIIELKCITPKANIYYTLDGGDPSATSIQYTGPIVIKDEDELYIRAIAIRDGMINSNITEITYNVNSYSVEFSCNGLCTPPATVTGLKLGDRLGDKIPEQLEFSTSSKTGYNFKYWTYENGNQVKPDDVISGDLKLIAVLENIPPTAVSEFSTQYCFHKHVTLFWTNPDMEDLAEVIITYKYDGGTEETISITSGIEPNSHMSREIYGLTNDKKYTFTIKLIDKEGEESPISTCIGTPTLKISGLDSVPQKLSEFTYYHPIEGATNVTYVEFGIWPQSRYDYIEELGTGFDKCDNINGWDNCYAEYDANNANYNYYVKVEEATPYEGGYEFDNGYEESKKIKAGKTYYFKLEPIYWRVLDEDFVDANGTHTKGKLLFAEKALETRRFDDNLSNYEDSEIRTYLNGTGSFTDKGFLQKAFTPEQRKCIKETLIDNSAASTQNSFNGKDNTFVCNNTSDKIFLLSGSEMTKDEYEFYIGQSSENNSKGDKNRQRKTTDYARAVGARLDKEDADKYGYYWLRSPDAQYGYKARYVFNDGYLGPINKYNFEDPYVDSKGICIVPALVVSEYQ